MPPLPAGYTLRPVTIDDLQAAVDLTNLRSIHDIGEGDMTLARMRMFWTEPERNLDTDNWCITAPDGALAAYADHSEYAPFVENGFDYAVHPDHASLGLEQAIFDIAETRARQAIHKAPPGQKITLETHIWSTNTDDHKLLRDLGFEHIRVWNRMLIEVREPPAEPTWPAGITVRTLQPNEIDAVHEAWEDAQRDEFGFASLTPEEFRRYLADEEENFDPTLWFLAIDDTTGAIAGYTLCRWERPGEPQTGHIRYLAVRRQYRRRGIAHALLLHTFGEFYRRGKSRVGLAVDSTSLTGADRLYERAGMHAAQRSLVLTKTLREATAQP